MKHKISLFFALFLGVLNADDLELKKIFEKYELNGTLVISSLHNEENYIFNDKRAHQRFAVASTFKIPHTLIALNKMLIYSANDTIQWDGIKRSYEIWNQDQTLKSAFLVSCVWCYQDFTTHLSKEHYLEYLEQFNYGSKTIGADKSSFWLDESLTISAHEQIDFLRAFYNNELGVDKKYIDITKNIMMIEKSSEYVLSAKSGWSGTIGWYVGYVKTNDNLYFFAMNADIIKEELPLRKTLILEALRAKKIITKYF